MKREGQVASFRVVARGTECIPVLEAKEWTASGQAGTRWTVVQNTVTEAAVATAGQAASAATGRGQREKEGEWQTVTSKRNEKAGEGKAKQAMPAKVTKAGQMLSVAKPTLSPKEGEGEGYMESEDIV